MLDRLWLLLGAVALAAAGIGALVLTAMSAGATKEKARSMRKAIEDAQDSHKIRRDVARGAGRDGLRRFDRD